MWITVIFSLVKAFVLKRLKLDHFTDLSAGIFLLTVNGEIDEVFPLYRPECTSVRTRGSETKGTVSLCLRAIVTVN